MVINAAHYKAVLTSIRTSLILLFLMASNITYAANISVNSSRNPVALDDSFHLIYEADSSVDDKPDFSPIYKYFDVLSSSQSTNMRSVNGSWSLKKTWDLSVIAKKVGIATIPAISFGKDSSPAIRINVKNSSTSNGHSSIPAKIFLEGSVDKKTGWVQSQFIYTIRLLRTVSIAGASISEPVISDADAIIQQLNEDKYQTTRNGIRYEVFERRYAIFPQKSGTIKINPVTFEGRINATQARSIFDQFRISGQLKRLRSKPISIIVKAAPSSINLQDWLPANNITIHQEWSDDIQNIKAGEPITRTITIAAQGLSAVQLPTLGFDEIGNLKQYPDKAITEDKNDAQGITGLKQIKVALIPAKAGNYTLPAIKLQWWNTKTNKAEIAEISPITITAIGQIQTPQLAPVEPTTPQQIEKTKNHDEIESTISAAVNDQPYWKWLSFLLAAAWFITIILLLKKPKTKTLTKSAPSKASTKSMASQVIKHAKRRDTAKLRFALIEWAKLFYSDDEFTNLSQISEHCSAQLKAEIQQLNQRLYSTGTKDWQSKNLITAFKKEQTTAAKKPATTKPALKPLYK